MLRFDIQTLESWKIGSICPVGGRGRDSIQPVLVSDLQIKHTWLFFFFYHHNMSPFELWYPSRYACWVVYPIKSPGRTNTLGSMNFFLQRLNMSMHACIYPSSLNILARNLVAYIRVGVQVQHVSLYLQVVTLNGRALQHYRGGWEYNNFYIWWWLYR